MILFRFLTYEMVTLPLQLALDIITECLFPILFAFSACSKKKYFMSVFAHNNYLVRLQTSAKDRKFRYGGRDLVGLKPTFSLNLECG